MRCIEKLRTLMLLGMLAVSLVAVGCASDDIGDESYQQQETPAMNPNSPGAGGGGTYGNTGGGT